MLNRIIIAGRLAHDVELRHTQSGTSVANFTIAVDRDFKDQNGGRAVDWVDVIAWRGTGEFAAKYLSKGRMAIVDGRLQIREWTDKEGNKRRNAEVVADHIYFCDSKREDHGSNSSEPENQTDQFSELDDDGGQFPF